MKASRAGMPPSFLPVPASRRANLPVPASRPLWLLVVTWVLLSHSNVTAASDATAGTRLVPGARPGTRLCRGTFIFLPRRLFLEGST